MRIHWHHQPWRRILLVICCLVIVGVVLPFVAMSYLDKGIFTSTNSIQVVTSLSENERIRLSVRSELRDLEKKRTSIRYEIDKLQQEMDSLKEKLQRQQKQLNSVSLSLEEALRTRDELSVVKPAILKMPLTLPDNALSISTKPAIPTIRHCLLDSCFDYLKCPLKSYFQVYLYPLDDSRLVGLPDSLKKALSSAINSNPTFTFNAHSACMFMVILTSQVEAFNFSTLQYWNGSGTNHIIIVLDNCSTESCPQIDLSKTGRAIVARSSFATHNFRHSYDIVLPTLGEPTSSILLPSILPARRRFLLSFSGTYVEPGEDETTLNISQTSLSDKYISGLLAQFSTSDDMVSIKTTCLQDDSEVNHNQGLIGQWVECPGDDEPLGQATFALILTPRSDYYASSSLFIKRLTKVISEGAVPVILGDFIHFPFDEFLEWERVAVVLPKARAPELHLILKTYSDADIVTLRRQGRLFLENYLLSSNNIIDTLISVLRYKLKVPAPAERNANSNPVANLSFGPVNQQNSPETDEMLGPLEPPYPSLSFQRNFSLTLNHYRKLFNEDFSAHVMSPWRPDDPVLPSDAKFHGSSFGFRPIGYGAGGSGKEFSEALGGNSPREQFTAVVLTYERQEVLIEGIASLKGLPYLNKVLVVWNGPQNPGPETLTWPDIGVPVQVIKAPVNSLNNRFIPWDAIETEAVLSLDDDARLRHDELIFAFRVWRENRERIVGFPGRFHAFDSEHRSWNYNSNHSCELSMVLTGAAFFHKYYMYAYTHRMYAEIRQMVDKLMNCEDIALNFLISHLTRKPPIKVTSKWTFRCPGCPVALSEHDSHFTERHDCINRFTELYGYNPLLFTQLRADSVLFKTRIPHDKQKCFKFV